MGKKEMSATTARKRNEGEGPPYEFSVQRTVRKQPESLHRQLKYRPKMEALESSENAQIPNMVSLSSPKRTVEQSPVEPLKDSDLEETPEDLPVSQE
ncbi:hypothetical protein COOONC_18600 [Cooperia oncophora]